jgi:hypothetical protein
VDLCGKGSGITGDGIMGMRVGKWDLWHTLYHGGDSFTVRGEERGDMWNKQQWICSVLSPRSLLLPYFWTNMPSAFEVDNSL